MYNLEELKPIIEEAIKSSKSMMEASSKTKMNFKTFFKYAKILGLFTPNQSGKGINKKGNSIPITDILNGKHNYYSTYKLGKRLIKEGIKEHQCEGCLLKEWNSLQIPLELHHVDGNPNNHNLSNLQLLCPNCHAQTENYRGKKK